ncbi:LYR motif-containing protein 2 [Pectinophora gossypiella]|uniref:LYR motif-containing protein 2 n=1 Tax=Pectinophora gossypiella TaxID=13191 RepID=UPI00214E4954|nr:LYR motif-containing protein 2 [Pectinophora gossypiella]
MSSKLPKQALSLKQFMLRQEVLKLYRDIFRTLRLVPDEKDRQDLKVWAKTDFRNNMHQTDEHRIKMMLLHGRKSLESLQKTLYLSKT